MLVRISILINLVGLGINTLTGNANGIMANGFCAVIILLLNNLD
ncbi:TPA: hypothetical protein ACOICL_002961 [Clostridioides difficile]|nr:hypothetical protein [Clostridioides difficile]